VPHINEKDLTLDDRTFFDTLFQQFSKTTRAENTFWAVEKDLDEDFHAPNGLIFPGQDTWTIYAVAQDQSKTFVGDFTNEVDADFVAGLHGCFPDLVRRLHDALDEADRADSNRDEREQEVFRLALENQELRQQIEAFRSKAADVLWKTERPM
jgi:hypothetical protein